MPVLKNIPMQTFVKFHQFAKLEDGKDGDQPTVWGIATLQQPDSDNELCEYESAKPVYQAWSAKALKRTKGAGQEASLGNIRVQHGSDVGGKATKLEFRDADKEIWLGSEPIDDAMRDALKKGFYTGYSQAGAYAWRACTICDEPLVMQQGNNYCPNCNKDVPVLYGLKRIAEVSYVDSPATGEGFEHVKANGSTEILKFAKKESIVAKTKTVAGEKLEASAFAHVGDPEKTETWKLPIKFSSDAKTKRHIRNALARIDQTKGMSDEERAAARAKIEAAAKEHGIDVGSDKSDKLLDTMKTYITGAALVKGVKLEKSLYDVARCADILMQLKNLWECASWELEIEGDGSEVPDELKELLDGMLETFIAMAEEEARELTAAKATSTGATTMTPEEIAAKAELEKAAKKSLASHFAKKSAHHEKMADIHEAIAEGHETKADHHEKAAGEMEECMGKATKARDMAKAARIADGTATKADTDPDDKGGEVDDHIGAAVTFHKAMAKEEDGHAADHMKVAKAHDKMAEHYGKMAEGCDADQAKATKAELEAEAKVEKDAAPIVIVPKVPTLEDDIKKAAEAARNSQAYKDAVAAIAQAQVDGEVEAIKAKTLAAVGTKIEVSDKLGKGGIVLRDQPQEETKLAARSSPSTVAGIY